MSVGILLVGHGSARYPASAAPMHALAQHLAATGRWSQVQAGFMKQSPKVEDVLQTMTASTVIVIPVFAGKGYYTDHLVPNRLGLVGPITRRAGQTILYTAPVGSHPQLPGIMACRADGVARSHGWPADQTSLLLIAHGSQRPGGAGETPRAIAAGIAESRHFFQVEVLFLEQEPWASQWAAHVLGPYIVALPLLIAQGTHASQDIPALFGGGEQSVWQVGTQQIALATGLGTEPDLVQLIVSMADDALSKFA